MPTGSHIVRVHTTCNSFAETAGIQINLEKLDAFLDSDVFADEARYAKLSKSLAFSFPLKFDNDIEELNLVGLLALLNPGGAFDAVLVEHNAGRDALDTIRAFVFSLYLSSTTSSNSSDRDLLTSRGMQNATLDDVASHARLSIMVEKPHPTMPAITVGEKGGPLLPFVQYLVDLLRETGKVLVGAGYENFGSFIAEGLKEAKGNPEVFISRLVRAFPAFDDSFTLLNHDVYLYRRAIYLVLMLPTRFVLDALPSSSTSTSQAQITAGLAALAILDQPQLPALANDTMTTTLLHLGIIDVSTARIEFESLRAISEQISESATATTTGTTTSETGNAEVERNSKADVVEKPVFIQADADAVWALLAASVLACDVMAERAQVRLGVVVENWRSGPVTAAGLSAFLSSAQRRDGDDVLPRIVPVATVS